MPGIRMDFNTTPDPKLAALLKAGGWSDLSMIKDTLSLLIHQHWSDLFNITANFPI